MNKGKIDISKFSDNGAEYENMQVVSLVELREALHQVAEMLNDYSTCHDDCMCNLCIAKQQTWEAEEQAKKIHVFIDRQAEEIKRADELAEYISEQLTQRDEQIKALKKLAQHNATCPRSQFSPSAMEPTPRVCNCGLDKALKGK